MITTRRSHLSRGEAHITTATLSDLKALKRWSRIVMTYAFFRHLCCKMDPPPVLEGGGSYRCLTLYTRDMLENMRKEGRQGGKKAGTSLNGW